jgi:tetratricopeptide (TPR) repeat protein
MTQILFRFTLGVSLAILTISSDALAGRGGGFRGGFGGGYGGGFRGGSVGMSSFERGGGMSYGSRGSFEGMNGGRINYGSRSGSYDTARGGTINYGAAGVGARGPGGAEAGRGVYGVSGTTAGGRSYSDVGRAGGVVGPGGNAFGTHSNLATVSGPRGTAVAGSRGYAGFGADGAAGGRYGVGAYRPYGYDAYGAYHRGWVNGYWNGVGAAAWGLGTGLGWGLASWGYGSSLYGMGYSAYSNPYYYGATGNVAGQSAVAAPYDYSQPINTVGAPASESVADPTMAVFDSGRALFKQGDVAGALQQANDALAKLPDDPTLHEFRAVCLFAVGRYDESAATLYAVLSVGPGWDWTTLIGLYPDVETYTAQLRALEGYCKANPGSATARFVLAYHYLTQGHNEAAARMLAEVVALKPSDTLSAKLLRQIDPPPGQPAVPAPSDPTPPPGATIAGTWTAKPAAGTEITLAVQPGGGFDWKVTQQGKTRQFAGSSTFGDGMLTLARDQGPALVPGELDGPRPLHVPKRRGRARRHGAELLEMNPAEGARPAQVGPPRSSPDRARG